MVQATLEKLRKSSQLQADKLGEVRVFSDTVSTAVWTLKRFGYMHDLKAEANLSLVVDKLSRELKIKWKEYVKRQNLDSPTLIDFSDWLNDQAEIYDECIPIVRVQPRSSKSKPYGHSGNTGVQTILTNTVTNPLSQSVPSCVMGGGKHKLSECPKFKELSVKARFNKVKKHNLCFSCFGRRHGVENCRSKKEF